MPSFTSVCVLTVAALLLLFFHVWINDRQSEPYMDELFHIPQACEFCDAFFQFRKPIYNPSITTLPGLYIPSLLICAITNTTQVCNPQVLRLTSMISALFTLPLLTLVLRRLQYREGLSSQPKQWLIAFALWLHPVYLFYANLYYTDAPATMYALLAWYLALTERHVLSSLAGVAATLTRQTNMVWHAFIVFDSILQGVLIHGPTSHLIDSFITTLRELWPHLAAAALYIAFLLINGGPAIGDREHHEVSLHYAMFPYFLGFHAISYFPFMPIFLQGLKNSISKSFSRRFVVLATSVASAMIALVLATGTQVHPFILSDNRHFTFYIYRRWLLKSLPRRLSLVPLYTWGILGPYVEIVGNGTHLRARLRIFILFACAALVLIPSPLLEPRYFTLGSFFLLLYRLAKMSIYLRPSRLILVSIFLIMANVALVFIFAELPFQRPIDPHMPNDKSPGRFMF